MTLLVKFAGRELRGFKVKLCGSKRKFRFNLLSYHKFTILSAIDGRVRVARDLG